MGLVNMHPGVMVFGRKPGRDVEEGVGRVKSATI